MDPARIHDEFPAPEFRPTQRQALADIGAAFEAGNEVVPVRAPTGSGKSLLARAVAGSAARGSEASATDPVGAYYTTPQVSQLDDAAAYARRLQTACDHGLTELRRQVELTPEAVARRDRLEELRSDLGWFVEDCENPESPTTWVVDRHPSEKGLVHCHSYDIQERLADHLADFGVDARVRTHDRDGRDAELGAWKRADDPDVFLSVKMEEALDLEGEACRWPLLCKAPYPNTQDSRVAARLDDDRWGWYYRTALRTIVQACGRIVRSPDDHPLSDVWGE